VVIYGATGAGIAAAVQLARSGRQVSLLEFGNRVGGVSASGLGATDIGNKRAIGGIAREFYRRLGRHYGREESWTFEPKVAEATFTAMLTEHAVTVHFHQRLSEVSRANGSICELRTEAGDAWSGKVFIDASYEGDLLAAAGVSYHVGREGNACYGEIHNGVSWGHPGHNFKLAVDPYVVPGRPESGLLPGVFPGDGGREGEGDNKVQAYNFRLCLTQAADRVPFPQPAGYDPQRYEVRRCQTARPTPTISGPSLPTTSA
jgi:flavin-dependent dehydrogenase